MNIVVTGSSGFLGSHLLPVLSRSYSVRAVTRRPPKNPMTGVDYVQIEAINSLTAWGSIIQDAEVVIHLAAYAHVTQKSQVDHQALYETNVLGTQNLVKQAISADVKQFIFISSIGAMASSSHHPLTEADPCQPDSVYGQSKLQAEESLIQLSQDTPLAYTILRPPLVYGPGNPGNMARLEKLVRLSLPLPLAAIHNQRSFVYVQNLVDAILTCINHPNAQNQTFLVSDGEDVSTPELLRKIAYHAQIPCRLFPVPSVLLMAAGQMGDQLERLTRRPLPLNSDTILKLTQSLAIDSQKIRNTLPWHPPHRMDEGLQAIAKRSTV